MQQIKPGMDDVSLWHGNAATDRMACCPVIIIATAASGAPQRHSHGAVLVD